MLYQSIIQPMHYIPSPKQCLLSVVLMCHFCSPYNFCRLFITFSVKKNLTFSLFLTQCRHMTSKDLGHKYISCMEHFYNTLLELGIIITMHFCCREKCHDQKPRSEVNCIITIFWVSCCSKASPCSHTHTLSLSLSLSLSLLHRELLQWWKYHRHWNFSVSK